MLDRPDDDLDDRAMLKWPGADARELERLEELRRLAWRPPRELGAGSEEE